MKREILDKMMSGNKVVGLELVLFNDEVVNIYDYEKGGKDNNILIVTDPFKSVVNLDYVVRINVIEEIDLNMI
ncbi:hypothetical protein ACQUFT_09130 [Mammaliicoccus lentus]|uniref:hypothetical protein n=1 Tax=Mammaliicoccus TaxID=2803850 RepID=UPI001EFB5B84|nr:MULTISPECIES: hypothetical protein [unclassified Mammaliicoccus]